MTEVEFKFSEQVGNEMEARGNSVKRKSKALLSILAAAGLILFGFQNCAKIDFQRVDGSLTQEEQDIDFKIVEIPVTGTKSDSYENLNLVILLDDSLSMSDEIEKVKKALDGFLQTVAKNQAITVSVYSITYGGIGIAKTIFYDVNGNVLPDSVKSDSDPSVASYERVFKMLPPQAQLKTKPDMEQSKFLAAKDKFFVDLSKWLETAKQSQNSNTETVERGLCALVRYIKDESLSKAGEKLSILIVSDEDDSSANNYCSEKEVAKAQPVAQLKFQAVTANIEYVADGTKKRDGGIIENVDDNKQLFGTACNNYFQYCPMEVGIYDCSEELKAHLQKNPKSYFMERIDKFESCKIQIFKNQAYEYTYQAAIKSKIEDFCTKPITNVSDVTFDNFTDYYKPKYGVYGTDFICNLSRLFLGVGGYPYDIMTDLTKAPDKIREFMLKKYGQGNVSVTTVVYDSDDQQCNIQVGSEGKKYLQLVQNGTQDKLWKKQSICADNYDAALAPTQHLVNWHPDLNYPLMLQETDIIEQVVLVSATGTRQVLKSDQFTIANQFITLKIDEVPMGSKVKVYLKK